MCKDLGVGRAWDAWVPGDPCASGACHSSCHPHGMGRAGCFCFTAKDVMAWPKPLWSGDLSGPCPQGLPTSRLPRSPQHLRRAVCPVAQGLGSPSPGPPCALSKC